MSIITQEIYDEILKNIEEVIGKEVDEVFLQRKQQLEKMMQKLQPSSDDELEDLVTDMNLLSVTQTDQACASKPRK